MRGNRHNIQFILILLIFSTFTSFSTEINIKALEETSQQSLKANEPLQTALCMNYIIVSIAKITSYKNKIILENEYKNIINNIDLTKIKDKEIVELYSEFMINDSSYEIKTRKVIDINPIEK